MVESLMQEQHNEAPLAQMATKNLQLMLKSVYYTRMMMLVKSNFAARYPLKKLKMLVENKGIKCYGSFLDDTNNYNVKDML